MSKRFSLEGHADSLLPEGRDWKLVWNDEFDGTELDRTKWSFRLNFWGRRFPAYTDQGVELDGKSNLLLHLVEQDGRFCSPQLQTGANSFDNPPSNTDNPWGQREIWPLGPLDPPKFMHRYGYYEIRCKFQSQPGWWSAFWLQSPSIGTTIDPAYSGIEVDVMENFTRDGAVTSGNIFGGYGKGFQEDARIHYKVEDTPDGYHYFGVDWSEKGYVFYCDGRETARTDRYVSHVEQFILVTTECQGYRSGDGQQADPVLKDAVLPDAFTVDFVRVFDAV